MDHLKSACVNTMAHMRLVGIEPSSVIFSQTKYMWLHRMKIAHWLFERSFMCGKIAVPKKKACSKNIKIIFDLERLLRIGTKCITINFIFKHI